MILVLVAGYVEAVRVEETEGYFSGVVNGGCLLLGLMIIAAVYGC
jgi:hypothetical protein